MKINFKKGWDRTLIILSVVWGGFCFIFVVENFPSESFGNHLFFSALMWFFGLFAYLGCTKSIEWVIAGSRDEDNEDK